MKNQFLASFAISSAVFAWSPAYSAEILDQENFMTPTGANGAFSRSDESFRRAQTVTAGLTGILSRIDIYIFADSNSEFAKFNILGTTNGVPDTVIGTADLFAALPDSEGWVSFTTSVDIVAGQVFGLEPFISSNRGWAFANPGTYAGGSDYFLNTGFGINEFTQNAPSDLFFRTYVTTGAVPEPATWAFMIFGFGAIGGAMRRQRKANVKVGYGQAGTSR